MFVINDDLSLPDDELHLEAIRAQGAGGQNVNKVSSAVHLRFDIPASSLPEHIKARLLKLSDQRITGDGVVIIKAQQFRSQLKNRDDAVARLRELIVSVLEVPRQRIATRPGISAQRRRLTTKTKHGRTKALRGKVTRDD